MPLASAVVRTSRADLGSEFLATDHARAYDAATSQRILAEAASLIRSFGFAGAHVTLIGGLVPPVLVPILDPAAEPHVGSADVDFCLSVAIVEGDVGAYERLEECLRREGFVMAREADGTTHSWRWIGGRNAKVTVEFFCPVQKDGRAGRLYRPGGVVGEKLSALQLDTGRLVDSDNVERRVTVEIDGHQEEVALRVTGLSALLASKVDALMHREKNKDAYDIVWVLEAWPGGPEAAAAEVLKSPVYADPEMRRAVEDMARLFDGVDSQGARRYAQFLATAADAGGNAVAGSTDALARRAAGAVAIFTTAIHRP
jgi:hypothetical protein